MGRVATRRRIPALFAMLCIAGAPIALGACSSSGGGSATATCGPSSSTTVRALDSLRFRPDCLNVAAGAVKVTLVDGGASAHTFQIHGIDGKIEVSAGESKSTTFHLAKGTYTYYCGVPGHEASGMKGTLIVR